MDQTQIQQTLNDAIQAIQRGEQARGRELLLQVVAADESIEPAWLWLSRVMDNPADQLVALENVLTLNPAHAGARERAQALREKLGLAEPPPSPPPRPPPPAPPLAAAEPDDDVLDNDPDQCLYCGKITETEAATCPFCHRNLLKAGFWKGNAAYWWLILISGIVLHFSILQPGLALLQVVLISSHVSAAITGMLMQVVPATGDVAAFVSSLPFYFLAGRVLIWLSAFFIIIASQNLAPGAAVVASLLDGLATGLGFVLGWVATSSALTYAAMDFGLLALATSIMMERAQTRVRQHTLLDRNIYGHVEYHRSGCSYARQSKWALAALHFQRAMVLGSNVAVYYKDLSAAQVRLGRYRQALRTLRMGAEMLPDDAEFPALIAKVEALPGRKIPN